MIKIGLFHSDGSPFNPNRFERELKEGVMNAADAKVQEILRGIRCPIHGQTPSAIRTATGYDIRGCCKDLKDAVQRRLGK